MSWPPWIFTKIPSEPVVVVLSVAAILSFFLGCVSILASYKLHKREESGGISFRLGLWQITDSFLYLLLAIAITRSGVVDIWAAIVMISVGIPVLLTFHSWSMERKIS